MMEPEEDLTLVDRIQRLPVEIREMVYSHLDNNEVLRSRAVNKQFKELAAEQLALSKRLPRNYVEISSMPDDPRSLDAFKNACQNLDFKILKIQIVHKVDFYDRNVIVNLAEFLSHPEMNWFLRECAPYVKYLSLQNLTLPIGSKEEVKFFESFKSLESFSCDELTWIKSKKRISVPCCFKNLKQLNIKTLMPSGMGATVASRRFRNWVTKIRATTTLEEFTCPDIEGRAAVAAFLVQRELVMDVIRGAMEKKKNKPIRIDMNGLFSLAGRVVPKRVEDRTAALGQILTPVIDLCARARLKLEDLNEETFIFTHLDIARTLIKSISLHNTSCFLQHDYPNLEEVNLVIVGDVHMEVNAPEPSYPKLRGADFSLFNWSGSKVFCDRFFRSCERPNLQSLSLEFRWGIISRPLTESDICNTCPNLTYLQLGNYLGDDDSFLALWERLPLLEYVSISSCSNITDNGLIGDAKKNRKMTVDHGIRALKNLKFLELTNLQGITDKLFKTTLRHMNLRGLRVASVKGWGIAYEPLTRPHSDRFKAWRAWDCNGEIQTVRTFCIKPVEQIFSRITMKGLRTLKIGVFAKSIEMLDLKYLKIRGVSQEQVTELQAEFRSANMIPA